MEGLHNHSVQFHIVHWAYNLTTGEVLGNNRACALRRSVKWHNHYAIKHGENVGKWVFGHGYADQAMAKVRAKHLNKEAE